MHIHRWLVPLSWLYGAGVTLRNTLFDMGVLSSQHYDIPIIDVGNLTVGGTGKTPHTEFLLHLLIPQYRVAVLSRGYRRKTRGYVLATAESTVEDIGDEPWQMRQKFPNAYVAVDSNRRRGIERLCHDKATCDVEVILLDDAYQHRYVQPGLNILLMDYHRLVTDDLLLPAGRLREPKEGMARANIIVVTKCPLRMTPMDYGVVHRTLEPRPYQQLFFSTFRYGPMQKLFGKGQRLLSDIQPCESVVLLTAIARPQQMLQDLQQYTSHITPLAFPDHHYFTPTDVSRINRTLAAMPSPRLIITTEKDATRLHSLQGLSPEVREAMYVLPVEVSIMRNEESIFNKKIIGYVRKNSRNSIVAKGQDEE